MWQPNLSFSASYTTSLKEYWCCIINLYTKRASSIIVNTEGSLHGKCLIWLEHTTQQSDAVFITKSSWKTFVHKMNKWINSSDWSRHVMLSLTWFYILIISFIYNISWLIIPQWYHRWLISNKHTSKPFRFNSIYFSVNTACPWVIYSNNNRTESL